MDDILVRATSRWKLRRAIRGVKEGLAEMGLRTHPDKTWVGKSEWGFDFLGYHVSQEGITVAEATVERCVTRIRRLDEQEWRRPSSPLGVYVSPSREAPPGACHKPFHCLLDDRQSLGAEVVAQRKGVTKKKKGSNL